MPVTAQHIKSQSTTSVQLSAHTYLFSALCCTQPSPKYQSGIVQMGKMHKCAWDLCLVGHHVWLANRVRDCPRCGVWWLGMGRYHIFADTPICRYYPLPICRYCRYCRFWKAGILSFPTNPSLSKSDQ